MPLDKELQKEILSEYLIGTQKRNPIRREMALSYGEIALIEKRISRLYDKITEIGARRIGLRKKLSTMMDGNVQGIGYRKSDINSVKNKISDLDSLYDRGQEELSSLNRKRDKLFDKVNNAVSRSKKYDKPFRVLKNFSKPLGAVGTVFDVIEKMKMYQEMQKNVERNQNAGRLRKDLEV